MKIRDLDSRAADKICDDGIYLGTVYLDGTKTLQYSRGNKFYRIFVTNDRDCWITHGEEYDTLEDLKQ